MDNNEALERGAIASDASKKNKEQSVLTSGQVDPAAADTTASTRKPNDDKISDNKKKKQKRGRTQDQALYGSGRACDASNMEDDNNSSTGVPSVNEEGGGAEDGRREGPSGAAKNCHTILQIIMTLAAITLFEYAAFSCELIRLRNDEWDMSKLGYWSGHHGGNLCLRYVEWVRLTLDGWWSVGRAVTIIGTVIGAIILFTYLVAILFRRRCHESPRIHHCLMSNTTRIILIMLHLAMTILCFSLLVGLINCSTLEGYCDNPDYPCLCVVGPTGYVAIVSGGMWFLLIGNLCMNNWIVA